MKYLFAFVLVFFCSQNVIAEQYFGDVIVSEVTSVYDGDTFKVNIPEYPDLIGRQVSIRINGIDTPEIRGKCPREKALALKAREHTANQLYNGKEILLRNVQRGKYFRIVADVYVDGANLGDSLIRHGFAVDYGGGRKDFPWCE